MFRSYSMCRNQVSARRNVLNLSTDELPPPGMAIPFPSIDQQSRPQPFTSSSDLSTERLDGKAPPEV